VKSGRLAPATVRELCALAARHQAAIGVLLTLHEPTAAMIAEAARVGCHVSPGGPHPRIQILTAEEVLRGRRIDCPTGHRTAALGGRTPAPSKAFPSVVSTRPSVAASKRMG
jgi:hypothetical protein